MIHLDCVLLENLCIIVDDTRFGQAVHHSFQQIVDVRLGQVKDLARILLADPLGPLQVELNQQPARSFDCPNVP